MGRLPEQFQANVAQLNRCRCSSATQMRVSARFSSRRCSSKLAPERDHAIDLLSVHDEEQVLTGGANQTVRNQRLDGLNQRMLDLQSALAAAKELYTPNHPQLKKIEAS